MLLTVGSLALYDLAWSMPPSLTSFPCTPSPLHSIVATLDSSHFFNKPSTFPCRPLLCDLFPKHSSDLPMTQALNLSRSLLHSSSLRDAPWPCYGAIPCISKPTTNSLFLPSFSIFIAFVSN